MSIWDKYDRGEIIGYGKSGNIYKCQNKYTKKYVAIKEIWKNETNVNYFKEIETMKKLENDNSVTLKETFDTKDYFYIVMELCICNLEQCIQMRENGFSIDEIKKLLIQINNTLKLSKDKNIIHRNLKPSNILISLNKIDNYLFKLSKFDSMSNTDFSLTMAPEIINEEEDLRKSDLWSIGIIIYYLYFKEYPFNGKNKSELFIDINSDKLLNEIDNTKLNDLMNKLLKKNVKERISWDEYFKHPFFTFKDKDELISKLKTQIFLLKGQLYNHNEKDLNNLPLFKSPLMTLKNHRNWVYCLTLLNDGRLVSGSDDNSIIIYNKEIYKPDLIINEHTSWINCLTTLKNGNLASCSNDTTIKLFDIKDNEYEIIQTLNLHFVSVNQIIEFSNNNLVSCSDDKTIIFYKDDNDKYKKDYSISTSDWVRNIIQIKKNEIAYSTYNERKLYFFDLNEKKKISVIEDIICAHKSLRMISKDLLLIPGLNEIKIIDINEHKIISEIVYKTGGMIYGVCMLNSNIIITGDEYGRLRLWKFDNYDLILLSEKKKVHKNCIFAILNLNNGHIATTSEDNTIKIW